jgi:hypothetical protein
MAPRSGEELQYSPSSLARSNQYGIRRKMYTIDVVASGYVYKPGTNLMDFLDTDEYKQNCDRVIKAYFKRQSSNVGIV